MKKVLALFLCLCMILPATVAFAASQAAGQTFSTDTLKDEVIFHLRGT